MPDENELEQLVEKNVIADDEIPFCCGEGYCDIPELMDTEDDVDEY